jgi:hypothetical protein
MSHILNFFRNISYRINCNSSIFYKRSNLITHYYKDNYLLKNNINIHKVKKRYDFNIFLFNILFTNQLDKKKFFNTSFPLLNKNDSVCIKIEDNDFYIPHHEIKLLYFFNKNLVKVRYKKRLITLNTHKFIKKNNIFFHSMYQKNTILNRILLHNFNIKYLNNKLKFNKTLLSFLHPVLKDLVGPISLNNITFKNFKISINNIISLLEEQYNKINISVIKEIFILNNPVDKKIFFSTLSKYHFMNLGNQSNVVPIGSNCSLDFLPNLKLDFFFIKKIWQKVINYEILTKINNIDYVVDLKLYQECLGLLFLRLKINFRDKIAKFHIISKNNKICAVLKSSVSFLKDIFNKNSIKLSEVSINNQYFFCNQACKDKKKYFNKLMVLSSLKKENKKLNTVLFFNKTNFKNIFLSSNKIDIYA